MNAYKGIPGWFDFQDVYDLIVTDAEDGFRLVEVGVLFGASAAYLMDQVAKSGKKISVHLVDHFAVKTCPENFSKEAKAAFTKFVGHRGAFDYFMHQGGYLGKYELHAKESVAAASDFLDKSLDFVFLDGGHTYEQVKKDILAYLPKLKKGGVMAGHDFDPTFPGVEKAVREVFGREISMIMPRSWWRRVAS